MLEAKERTDREGSIHDARLPHVSVVVDNDRRAQTSSSLVAVQPVSSFYV